MTKPKLIFFQYKHDRNLPKFVLLHRQEHVKCLSEFFEVVVINEDCDYQQICDQYQPDITLFESGNNYVRCHRINISNTSAFPEIPKVGFHNGDSWCGCRSIFISDMDHWGIETFFSICTTTGEYTPDIADNLFVWPNFIDPDKYKDYGESKIVPVLFTGFSKYLYPWRQRMYQVISQYYPSLICPHLGYDDARLGQRMLSGEKYARTLNASFFAPTCGSVAKEIVRKHFEIPGAKSCLITEKTPSVEAAGFIDMQNCVFADEVDVLDKLNYLFQNPDELERITNAGYQLVHAHHTLKQRDQLLQWFNLYKTLKPSQRIIQTSPFKPLTIVDKSSGIRNSHIIGDGLIKLLLRQGDEKLWAGKYKEAENLYISCLNYVGHMPEPKLKLALCNLYKGNAAAAFFWIEKQIKYSLEEYKALDPDPVEWAYLIISLLCQGKLENAIQHANQFQSLCHPELDRTRWVINILCNPKIKNKLPQDKQLIRRYSVHTILPNQNLFEWVNNLCIMLKACKQFHLVTMLETSISLEDDFQLFDDQNMALERISKLKFKLLNNQLELMRIFNNLKIKFKLLAKKTLIRPLNYLEAQSGYFLPSRVSEIRNDELFCNVQKLVIEKGIKTALVIGACPGKISTKAILTATCNNPNTPRIFCINFSNPRLITNQKHYPHHSGAIFYNLSLVTLEKFSEEIDKLIKQIKQENKIDTLDLVVIDSSSFPGKLPLKILNNYEAKFVLIDHINTLMGHQIYNKLLSSLNYNLITQNTVLRQGYAIFNFD
jgi:hypothetical protein